LILLLNPDQRYVKRFGFERLLDAGPSLLAMILIADLQATRFFARNTKNQLTGDYEARRRVRSVCRMYSPDAMTMAAPVRV
jgi:hypothetical protein